MKFPVVLIPACICLALSVQAQQAPPPVTPAKDSAKADVIAVASLQLYPTSVNQPIQNPDTTEILENKTPQPDPGPKRDWNNPPGFIGFHDKSVTMGKHKTKARKKYQHRKRRRCYSF